MSEVRETIGYQRRANEKLLQWSSYYSGAAAFDFAKTLRKRQPSTQSLLLPLFFGTQCLYCGTLLSGVGAANNGGE